MQDAGVPLVPGMTDSVGDVAEAVSAAEEIGYPVALKAAAGGGGKGIRVVRKPAEMETAFRTASGEAVSAFGDGRLYLERYLDRPRHIEVQVLFDSHGDAVHLGERECSIQRRHQKLIEESPSVVVDEALRAEMGEVALQAGRAVNYEGAGTVEFLWSGGEFFFLEMNTRLQVEHPVTEMVTGIDLVREQLRVAAGEPLGYGQDAIEMRGHSMEVRINAEDTTAGFVPSVGIVKNLRMPGGAGVRIDSCLYRGMEVGLAYDPMLAKVIVQAHDRPTAIRRMHRALEELNVSGVRISAPAAIAVLEEEAFQKGDFDTHFRESLDLSKPRGKEELLAAAVAAIYRRHRAADKALAGSGETRRGWRERSRAMTSTYSQAATRKSTGGDS